MGGGKGRGECSRIARYELLIRTESLMNYIFSSSLTSVVVYV